MAIRKLKTASMPLSIPAGIAELPTPILFWAKNEAILWANNAYQNQFGNVSTTQFQNLAPLHLVQEKPIHLEHFSMLGRHEGFALKNSEGAKVPVELKVASLGNAKNETFIVMIDDVSVKAELENQLIQNHLELQKAHSELKTAQDALIQSAKLASLGELSSGIAHELNQPLQAIMGFSQELEHIENLSNTGKEFLGDIISASKKMAEIIKSLRTFARQAGDDIEETNIEHAITEAAHLMNHQLMSMGIEINIKKETPLPLLIANPIQLEQVFINFFSNARDAIEQKKQKTGKIEVRIHATSESIIVKIKDNGCGMSKEVQAKIFDPFFTTKVVGKGTGLGMSISYGILNKLNTSIHINSKTDEGSEFTLTFPINPNRGENHDS